MNIERLLEIDACGTAVLWCKSYKDLESAWLACERGDWMAWYIRRVCKSDAEKRKIAGVLAEIVETVIHLTTDQRARDCVDACKAYSQGEDVDLRSAADSAYAASADSAYAASADSAYAASAASYAASAASYAASYACAAACSAACSASDASDASAAACSASDASADERMKSLKNSADIIRKHYPTIPNI